MSNKVIVILAGGVGSRISSLTAGIPKQFFQVAGQSMLERTSRRFCTIQSDNTKVMALISDGQKGFISKSMNNLLDKTLIAPCDEKGTARAMRFAVDFLSKQYDPKSTSIIFVSCDQIIGPEKSYIEQIQKILNSCKGNFITLIGSKVTQFNSNLGYIWKGTKTIFLEKPEQSELDVLRKTSDKFMVNTGHFAGSLGYFLTIFKNSEFIKSGMSFDKAILQSNKAAFSVQAANFEWQDISSSEKDFKKFLSFSM